MVVCDCQQASAGTTSWREGERIEEPMPDHGAALRLVASFLSRSLAGGPPSSPKTPGAEASAGSHPSSSPAVAAALAADSSHAKMTKSGGSSTLPAGAEHAFDQGVLAVGHRVVHGGGIAQSVLIE